MVPPVAVARVPNTGVSGDEIQKKNKRRRLTLVL
jgi:hypothetical protein